MQRKHIIEVIIAVLVLIALIFLLLFILRKPDVVDVDSGQQGTDTGEDVDLGQPTEVIEDVEEPHQELASTISRTFVERFGSYSTDGGYSNVEDVMAIATPSLAVRLQDLAEEARDDAGDEYYGISTRVISTKTISETDDATTLEIVTQRTESVGSPGNSTTFYQTITLNLVRDDLTWLVSDFFWE